MSVLHRFILQVTNRLVARILLTREDIRGSQLSSVPICIPAPLPSEIFYHLLLEIVYYGEFSYC